MVRDRRFTVTALLTIGLAIGATTALVSVVKAVLPDPLPYHRPDRLNRDREGAPVVAVINAVMAERYWPGQEALGKRFHMGTDARPWITVVGIVAQVRHNAVTEPARAEMYIPHAQLPDDVGSAPRAMTLVVRTPGDPLALVVSERAHEIGIRLALARRRPQSSGWWRARDWNWPSRASAPDWSARHSRRGRSSASFTVCGRSTR